MKIKITCRPRYNPWLKKYLNAKTFSKILAFGILINSIPINSFAGILSEDTRYETFEGDYITIDNILEEGSIELDEIQGNTMVNHAQNSDRELILNEEIDLEGTSVTTEAVDGGLVDIEIGGNTLVVDENGNKVEPGTEGARLVSVGQDDVRGHKIEISSYDNTFEQGTYEVVVNSYCADSDSSSVNHKNRIRTDFISVEQGDNIKISVSDEYKIGLTLCDVNKTVLKHYNADSSSYNITIEDSNVKYIRFVIRKGYDGVEKILPMDIYSSLKSNILESKLDKKEILLKEPLRGLPNGVKDRFVKKDGKWYVERNCGYSNVLLNKAGIGGSNYSYTISFKHNGQSSKTSSSTKYNSLITNNNYGAHIACADYSINKDRNTLYFNFSEIENKPAYAETLEAFKEFINNKTIEVVYELTTPIYEPLEIEPVVNIYSDVTHISNNSVISANMKIKNSGYDCILKPNTEYTVAVDTDKSGTIGVNLGGVKGKTDNNILTLTTPEILIDNSLRLYGKGIKVKNIRVLEGDKTDNIPAYFEGIKSVGQDNINGHKIEIASNNKNLFPDINNINKTYKSVYNIEGNSITIDVLNENDLYSWIEYKIENLKIGKTYVISYNRSLTHHNSIGYAWLKSGNSSNYAYGTPGNSKIILKFTAKSSDAFFRIHVNEEEYIVPSVTISDIQLEESLNTEYTPYQSNKLEIPLTEPLRGLPNGIKDRIIKRNGQWVIERNCGEVLLDGSENWGSINSYRDGSCISFHTSVYNRKNGRLNMLSDKFNTDFTLKNDEFNQEGIFGEEFSDDILIAIDKSKLKSYDINGFKNWLSENPVKVVYQLETPIYEPLNIDFTINTYLETTHISNNSTIPANMKITIDRVANRAKEYSELAKENPTIENISLARMWTNKMRESTLKDEFQDNIGSITEITGMTFERKTASSNVDVYIKCENMLSMNLSTNSITFDDFSGVEDMVKENAVNISINSSLPYNLNAYLATDIQNSDKSNTMNKDILSIKDNSEADYQTFTNTTDKVVLKSNCDSGNDKQHNINLKLNGGIAHEKDVYKTTIKFEAEQQ